MRSQICHLPHLTFPARRIAAGIVECRAVEPMTSKFPGDATAFDNKVEAVCLLGLIIAAAFLRLVFIHQPMRFDESFTFWHFASKPLVVALSSYSAPNNHLFNTLLVHIAYRLLGNEPWILRLPAFLAGVAIVPAVYFAACSMRLVRESTTTLRFSTNG